MKDHALSKSLRSTPTPNISSMLLALLPLTKSAIFPILVMYILLSQSSSAHHTSTADSSLFQRPRHQERPTLTRPLNPLVTLVKRHDEPSSEREEGEIPESRSGSRRDSRSRSGSKSTRSSLRYSTSDSGSSSSPSRSTRSQPPKRSYRALWNNEREYEEYQRRERDVAGLAYRLYEQGHRHGVDQLPHGSEGPVFKRYVLALSREHAEADRKRLRRITAHHGHAPVHEPARSGELEIVDALEHARAAFLASKRQDLRAKERALALQVLRHAQYSATKTGITWRIRAAELRGWHQDLDHSLSGLRGSPLPHESVRNPSPAPLPTLHNVQDEPPRLSLKRERVLDQPPQPLQAGGNDQGSVGGFAQTSTEALQGHGGKIARPQQPKLGLERGAAYGQSSFESENLVLKEQGRRVGSKEPVPHDEQESSKRPKITRELPHDQVKDVTQELLRSLTSGSSPDSVHSEEQRH